MSDVDRVRAGLAAAAAGPGGGAAANRLCAGCVDLLAVDGAALSLINTGASYSVGLSGSGIDALAELQFTLGEGPCLDVVDSSAPVLTPDLNNTQRWPTFAGAATRLGIRAVFAIPVTVAGFPIGVLALCRHLPGGLTGAAANGAFLAAELAVLPLLDVMGTDLHDAVDNVGSSAWDELGSMMRSEVYQATGVLVAQLGVPPAEAMVRMRAHAFATGCAISDIAFQILDHRLFLDNDDDDRSGSAS